MGELIREGGGLNRGFTVYAICRWGIQPLLSYFGLGGRLLERRGLAERGGLSRGFTVNATCSWRVEPLGGSFGLEGLI